MATRLGGSLNRLTGKAPDPSAAFQRAANHVNDALVRLKSADDLAAAYLGRGVSRAGPGLFATGSARQHHQSFSLVARNELLIVRGRSGDALLPVKSGSQTLLRKGRQATGIAAIEPTPSEFYKYPHLDVYELPELSKHMNADEIDLLKRRSAGSLDEQFQRNKFNLVADTSDVKVWQRIHERVPGRPEYRNTYTAVHFPERGSYILYGDAYDAPWLAGSRVHSVQELGDASVLHMTRGDWLEFQLRVDHSLPPGSGFFSNPTDGRLLRPVTADDMGLAPFSTHAEPSDFVHGQRNDPDFIQGLTEINGTPIAELEQIMRPGEFSTAGFLGLDDDLRNVMARDAALLGELNLQPGELASPIAVCSGLDRYGISVTPGPAGPIQFDVVQSRGFQGSPFGEEAMSTWGSTDYVLTNTNTGETLHTSQLGNNLGWTYNFWQGPGTPYRTSPEEIIKFFRLADFDQVDRAVAAVNAKYRWS